MKIITSQPYLKNQVKSLIENFDKEGATLRADRNVIKIFDVNEEHWNVKSFKIPNLINKVVYRYIRKSKAQRSFENANFLLSRNIQTPKPIAYAENYFWGTLGRSFYISENINYDFTFMKLYENKDFPDRENILNQFTIFTFKLHENGIDFLDHNHGNTLIVNKGNGEYAFFLVDLNRMQFGNMDLEARLRNFQKLHLTREMADIIGKKYASLMHLENTQMVQDKIWQAHISFTERRKKKKKLKRKFGL